MIKDVRHIGIVVTDMEKSLKFYRDLLGLKIKSLVDEEGQFLDNMLAHENVKNRVAKLYAKNGNALVELIDSKSYGNKNLYLFDTFEGLPNTKDDDLFVQKGWLHDTSVESVKKYLTNYKNIHFLKGVFPETSASVSSKKFSFVHLDANLYQTTLDALEFFWPRMISRGRIVCHDYNTNSMPGIKKAFSEFFKNEPEKIIEIADSQVMVVK